LLNPLLPSQHGETAAYDLLVFRRLTQPPAGWDAMSAPTGPTPVTAAGTEAAALTPVDTQAVGFAVFDRVVLSVHPAGCSLLEGQRQKLLQAPPVGRDPASRLPSEPADLMLRLLNTMVDGYLDLRRVLTRDMDRWQTALLSPRAAPDDWQPLLRSRLVLHQLDELCEGQRAAIQDWIEAIKTWRLPDSPAGRVAREQLLVRSQDVREHVERVIHHIDRLERSAETAVQLHFSLQSNRTNDSMRTLTALTAVFLPLNLVTGFFGMNFEFLPLIHNSHGLWWALLAMAVMATVLGTVLWRRRGLARRRR
jgi:Mg2+ and Co2+ transporter CorA